jgi:hypothetical protein
MNITQSGSALSGTFSEAGISRGSLSGTVVNTTMSVALTYTVDPECPLKLSGAVVADRWSTTGMIVCTGPNAVGPNPRPYNFVRTP